MPPPVVLLHGLATSATRTWVENGWVDILTDEGLEALAPDLPGHDAAASEDPADYADFEEQVVEMLPDGGVDLVGFSLGARTAALIAARHPDRVRRLVLLGVGENLFRSEGHGLLLAAALDELRAGRTPEPPELAATAHHFAQLAGSCGVPLGGLVALLRRPDGRVLAPADLAPIRAVTLIALGDRDFAGPIGPLHAAIPHATARELRGVDHFATPRSMAAITLTLAHLAG